MPNVYVPDLVFEGRCLPVEIKSEYRLTRAKAGIERSSVTSSDRSAHYVLQPVMSASTSRSRPSKRKSPKHTLPVLTRSSLESIAETLTGRLDHVNKQLEDLKAAVRANGEASFSFNQPTVVDWGVLGSFGPSQHHASSVGSSQIRSPPVNGPIVAEPSRDFSHIPPHRTTADTVLTWPIFGGRFESNYLIQPLLCDPEVADPRSHSTAVSEKDNFALVNSIGPPDDERIPALVDSFLQNVHTKNPVLDVETLLHKSREASISGLGWDAHSCCVLLACALGCIAKPFQDDQNNPKVATPKELQMGEQCFVLACRRLGLLKQTVLAAQCHFFAGGKQLTIMSNGS